MNSPKIINNEILRSLMFFHSSAGDFVQSQWQTESRSVVYLIYKWILAVYFFGVFILSLITSTKRAQLGYYTIFWTNWGVVYYTFSTFYGAILTTVWHLNSKFRKKLQNDTQDGNNLPTSFKFYWFVVNGASVMAINASVLYWTLLYKESDRGINNFFVHAGNSIGMGLDLLIARWPCHISHTIYTVCGGTSYLLFSWIYFLTEGTNIYGYRYIYPVLNWGDPNRTIIVAVGSLILGIICQFIVYLIYKFRVFIYRKIYEDISKSKLYEREKRLKLLNYY